jgi:hypothetical protein
LSRHSSESVSSRDSPLELLQIRQSKAMRRVRVKLVK